MTGVTLSQELPYNWSFLIAGVALSQDPVRKLSWAQCWLRPFEIGFKKMRRVRSCETVGYVRLRWATHRNVFNK